MVARVVNAGGSGMDGIDGKDMLESAPSGKGEAPGVRGVTRGESSGVRRASSDSYSDPAPFSEDSPWLVLVEVLRDLARRFRYPTMPAWNHEMCSTNARESAMIGTHAPPIARRTDGLAASTSSLA